MKPGTLTRTPSASELAGAISRTSPLIARAMESTPSTWAPTTRTRWPPKPWLPDRVDSARATPEARPPPPIGTITTSGAYGAISMPMVPWPAITSGSSNADRKR